MGDLLSCCPAGASMCQVVRWPLYTQCKGCDVLRPGLVIVGARAPMNADDTAIGAVGTPAVPKRNTSRNFKKGTMPPLSAVAATSRGGSVFAVAAPKRLDQSVATRWIQRRPLDCQSGAPGSTRAPDDGEGASGRQAGRGCRLLRGQTKRTLWPRRRLRRLPPAKPTGARLPLSAGQSRPGPPTPCGHA